MRVLIFENAAAGHRLQHVRVGVQAIADLDVEIVFATGVATPSTDEFRTHLASVVDRVTVDATLAVSDTWPPWRVATRRVTEFLAAIERHRPDHVYVPYADGFAQASGAARALGLARRRKGIEVEGILMRGRFAYPRSSVRESLFAHAWLAATVRSPIDVFHFLDPIPYEWILARRQRLAARARLIPEPVEPPTRTDRMEARRLLGLPAGGRIVCCLGWLDRRKGVDRLIRAFVAAADALRPDDRLLLVGHVDGSIRDALQHAADAVRRGRVVLHGGVVSDEHLHRAIAAADVVAAPYPRHIGSSGIVVRAAALDRMVLASDYGWIGMVTNRFGLGLACDCRDEAAIARMLPAALEASASFRLSPAALRFTRFHTQANYQRHLSRRLRQRLGMGADGETLTWDWVMQSFPPGDAPGSGDPSPESQVGPSVIAARDTGPAQPR